MSSVFSAPHPMVPLATFNVDEGRPALEVGSASDAAEEHEITLLCDQDAVMEAGAVSSAGLPGGIHRAVQKPAARDRPEEAGYSLFHSDCQSPLASSSEYTLEPPPGLGGEHDLEHAPPDFLGRLHHLKTLFRMSATTEPVSMMIHRVGPLLILDDGPYGECHGTADQSKQLPPHWSQSGPPPGLSDSDDATPSARPTILRPPPGLSDDDTPRARPTIFRPPPGLSDDDKSPRGPVPSNISGSGTGAVNGSKHPSRQEAESQLLLAPLDAALESLLSGPVRTEALGEASEPNLGLLPAAAPASELAPRLYVKNTFLDVHGEDEENYEDVPTTHSAPGRIGARTPASPSSPGQPAVGAGAEFLLPLTPVVQRLEQHMEQLANAPSESSSTTAPEDGSSWQGAWSLIPYQPEVGSPGAGGAEGVPSIFGSQWDLLQLASTKKLPKGCQTLEAMRLLFSGIPPQPSRFGRAMEWRCGPYKILLGCDLVVFQTDEHHELDKFASFKMLPSSGSSSPSREERLDVYLENLMCDIKKAVLGYHQQGQTSWHVFNTNDLPAAQAPDDEAFFDAESLLDQGQRLLHFLRQQCRREGGTYWLFREQNAPVAELFDLTPEGGEDWQNSSRGFGTTPSLAMPIASLCFHIAKTTRNESEQRQLLQKCLHLIEPLKEEHPWLYAMAALQLACSYMRAPQAAIPDTASTDTKAMPPAEAPAAARLSVALRYLEGMLRLLTKLEDTARDELAIHAELHLQAHVAYAECIVKLVREACIPTYSAWLAEVQPTIAEMSKSGANGSPATNPATLISEMKRLSAAFLFWRLFWLCRAHRALDFVPRDKRETECWVLERDLNETMADALYGLSRYPADDADDLLAGQMRTTEGICQLVAEGLRSWGLRGGCSCLGVSARTSCRSTAQHPVTRSKKKKHSLTGSLPPGKTSEASGTPSQPHNVNAMFLSKLNPLARGFNDEELRDNPLLQDNLRPALWSDGGAFKKSLALFEKAAARLKKVIPSEDDTGAGQRKPSQEEQATLKVARKLAHMYNEEARAALVRTDGRSTEGVEELLMQAHRWMLLSGDHSNASRVLLNLSELHARRAESLTALPQDGGTEQSAAFSEPQYRLWLKAIECCEEAASLSDNTLGRREGAFAHLRVGVHLSTRVPVQLHLLEASRREETLAELADRHFSKALRGFDELHDEREVAVCHFHMADLALQELRAPGAPALSKARLISALRHARRSSDYWERVGALQYAKDFLAANVRTARLLEHQQKTGAVVEALEHLAEVEARLLSLHSDSVKTGPGENPAAAAEVFVLAGESPVAVTALRREMSRVCQAGLRQGGDVDRLKKVYRQVLRNEPLALSSTVPPVLGSQAGA
mmetsp:Transcript_104655/g.197166  ORF Transcript_104655/g.197166 Transcript_104655/m.197166 type:complete len:1365 (+) Transcript_104655:59-4153(+)